MNDKTLCPCGSGKTYEECCKIAHLDISAVKTAEQLMRSRYTAFTLANSDYLHISHHPSTRPKSKRDRDQNSAWAKSVVWLKLEIISTVEGMESDSVGRVEFKAHFLEKGKPNQIHENSSFSKKKGHWVYLDGCYDFQ